MHLKARRGGPNAAGTELHDLTMGMLGSEKYPEFGAKGQETRCLLPFFVELLNDYKGELISAGSAEPAEALTIATKSIISMVDVMNKEGRSMSADGEKLFREHYLKHVRALTKLPTLLGINFFIPKHHIWLHATRRVGLLGNPKYSSTYRDESNNHGIAKISHSTHRTTFAMSVYRKAKRAKL